MGSKLFYKLMPGDFLEGILNLKPNEIAAYTAVIMLNYEAGGYIADDPAIISSRYKTNVTGAKNAIDALVEKGRLKRVTVGGKSWIYDERAIFEMEILYSKAKRPRTVFKGKIEQVPAKSSEKPNKNSDTDFIEENGQVRANLDDLETQVRANLSQDREIIARSGPENPLETDPIEDNKNKKGAHVCTPARARTRDQAFEGLGSLCEKAGVKAKWYFNELVKLDPAFEDGTFIVPDNRDYGMQENLGLLMSDLGLKITRETDHKIRTARARRKSAGGSGADVSKAGAQEPQPSLLSIKSDLADHEN